MRKSAPACRASKSNAPPLAPLSPRSVCLGQVGKTPVLLSLLILVLGALERPGAKATLPSSIYELYTCAMDAAIANSLGAAAASGAISPIELAISPIELAKSMLRRIASANMLAQRRTFSLERHVLETLAPHPDELCLWRQMLHTSGSNGASSPVPLVKVLALGHLTGEFQFKHLSFQEALFVQAITRREADAFWQTDKVAAARLNDAFYTNTFRIGEGCLGHALGQQRPTWSFAHELLISGHADRGLARLHRLLPRSVSLASLTLPLNPSGDAASDFCVPITEDGPSPFWMLPSLPAPLNQSFRSARVLGVGKARGLCARRYLVTSPLDVRGTPEPWVALEPGGSQHAVLPAAWFEAETGAVGLEFGCEASDEATDGAGGEDGEDGESSSLPSSRSGSTTASASRQDSAALEGDHVILRKHTRIIFDQGADTPMLLRTLSLLPADPLRLEELSVPELHALLAQLLPGSSAAGFVSSAAAGFVSSAAAGFVSSVVDTCSHPLASLARFTGAAGYLEVLLVPKAAHASECR